MKKLLMFLRAVKLVFTEYAEMRAYIFNDQGPDDVIWTDWTASKEDSNKARPREAVMSQLRNRVEGGESRTISTLGFDGVFPRYERRGNTKRKLYNQKLYLVNKTCKTGIGNKSSNREN